MLFVELRPRPEKVVGLRPKLTSSKGALRGLESTSDVDCLLNQLQYQYCKPTADAVRLESASLIEGHFGTAVLHLAQVGFELILGDLCRLSWARFEVTISSQSEPAISTPRLEALLPTMVKNPMEMSGPIRVHDSGLLGRDVVPLGAAGSVGVHFLPELLGFIVDESTACWDFFPDNGRPTPGSDKLLMSLRVNTDSRLKINQQLWICIEGSEIPPLTFECPHMELTVTT